MRSALSRRLLALALTVAIAAPASAFPPDAFQPDVQLPSVGQGVGVQPNQQPAPIPSGPQNIGRDAVARLPDADRAIAAPLLQAGDAAASALGLGRDQYSISVNLQTRTATVVPNAGSAVGDGPIRVTVSPDNPGQFQATMSARQFAGSDAGRALFSRAGAPAMDGAAGRSMVTVGFQTVDGVARVTSVTASRGASDSLFGNRGQGDTPREMTPIEREAVRLVAGANPPANVQVRTAPGNPNSISVTMTARDFVSSPAARQLLPGGPADAEALRGPAGLALVTINVERQGGELRVTGLSVDRGAGASLFGQQRVTDLSTPQPAAPPRI
ncbi:MAG: hypothetical protein JO102_01245, partial [Elusimicrobia bacterium]|nr:hypothetical protein [Elusimicrobiota bacterium]